MGSCSFSPWHWKGFVLEGRGRRKGRGIGLSRDFSNFSPRLSSKACTITIHSKPAKLRVVVHCEHSPARATTGNTVGARGNERVLVEECLKKVSFATGVSRSNVNLHLTVSGKQYLYGMEGEWSFSWCTDGRFYEKYEGQEITYEWGFDGVHNPWFADFGGRVTALELDDLEIAQLAVYVRTGFWLTDNAQDKLNIQIEGEDSFKALRQQFGKLGLTMNLRDGKVVARMTIDACHWLPISMDFNVLGKKDRWEYKDWNSGAGAAGSCLF